MENKHNYSLNVVFAKGKCITDFFVKNTVDSIILPLVLMMPGCGCTRTAGAVVSAEDIVSPEAEMERLESAAKWL